MHSIEYNGTEYRSWRDACSILCVNYNTFRRYCRHYLRAYKNPAVALDWLLGIDKRKAVEPKTVKWSQDYERALDRLYKYQERRSEKLDQFLS